MNRAERRHYWAKKKAWAKRLALKVWRMRPEWVTDQWVSHMAETHGRPCSCEGCRKGTTKQYRLNKDREKIPDDTPDE